MSDRPIRKVSIIRKVSVLRGRALEVARATGASDDDLVILTILEGLFYPIYVAEKIVGDPLAYLLRPYGTVEVP